MRFTVAGAAVAVLYLVVTTTLASFTSLPFQVALGIGFSSGLVAHFTLQRVFVWAHGAEYALAVRHQVIRYLVVAAVQYAVTAAVTHYLPPLLDLPVTPVYVVTALIVAAVNFLVFRTRVFHRRDAPGSRPQEGLRLGE